MTREDILQKVNEIFKDAFDREELTVDYKTTAADIEGWDSLMQMNLIEIIEDEFEIRFSMNEVVGMENVGAMVDIILARI